MKCLYIGDIVGRPGREIVGRLVPELVEAYGIDVVMANGENIAHGIGATPGLIGKLEAFGVHLFALGNHAWRKPEMVKDIDKLDTVARPANFPPNSPGKGTVVYSFPDGRSCALINLIGRVFMEPADCPFAAADRELEKLNDFPGAIVVDIHAEATSEKAALAWYLDGRCSAVLGTHTHVQTSDERLLPKGTAFISDVGMCGPHDSILGVKTELVLQKTVTGIPAKWDVADGPVQFNAVVVQVDDKTGLAKSIERIRRIETL
ncbi:MAG: YmdB family metallophosphoesterase [Candidatus Hydrogenedens sp.]|jgi:metallophosphoesterase (TIGR00282 family)|nr:YmdB family metallophosphoesterase [Candidatus Hydrogenedens sp.]